MHLLERAASRSFTTAESSTSNRDVEDDDDEFELGREGEGEGDRPPAPPGLPLLSVLALVSRARPDLLVLHRPLRPSRPPSARCASSSRARARSTLKSTRTLRVLLRPETRTPTRESPQAQLAALRAQGARLELAWRSWPRPTGRARCTRTSRTRSPPLEKGVRRVERHVGRLRAGRKELEGASPSHSSSAAGVRVPVRIKARRYSSPAQPKYPHTMAFALVSSWFGGSLRSLPLLPTRRTSRPRFPPRTAAGAGKRRALDSIPEEEGRRCPAACAPPPSAHPPRLHPRPRPRPRRRCKTQVEAAPCSRSSACGSRRASRWRCTRSTCC
ncbi:hypothetical protein B0H14DRAFT_107654 [Mycena olivaceomarginata]|nr:hypothetical protein B0H14DRAFT_107654 [Mycena olivaceomarginata]